MCVLSSIIFCSFRCFVSVFARYELTMPGYFRVRFDDGYVFRIQAPDLGAVKEIVSNHFWWGEQKPSVSEIKLHLKSRKNDTKVWYVVEAPGYPKGVTPDESF